MSVHVRSEDFRRPGTSLESLASLPSSFEKLADLPLGEEGNTYRSMILKKYPDLVLVFVHHPGNSSGVVDGAAAILVTSPDYAKAHGLTPRARVLEIGRAHV